MTVGAVAAEEVARGRRIAVRQAEPPRNAEARESKDCETDDVPAQWAPGFKGFRSAEDRSFSDRLPRVRMAAAAGAAYISDEHRLLGE
jgi:hypothetical protein